MYAVGFSLNLLTLFALVLVIGTVVDDSIVVVEAVRAKLGKGNISAFQATVEAMKDLKSALITATISLCHSPRGSVRTLRKFSFGLRVRHRQQRLYADRLGDARRNVGKDSNLAYRVCHRAPQGRFVHRPCHAFRRRPLAPYYDDGECDDYRHDSAGARPWSRGKGQCRYWHLCGWRNDGRYNRHSVMPSSTLLHI